MDHRVRFRNSQIGHEHSRLDIDILFLQFFSTTIRVLMEADVARFIIASRGNWHTEIGNLNVKQLRLFCKRVEMRRRHQVMIHGNHTASRKKVNHVDQQVIVHTKKNIRFIQGMNLLSITHRINLKSSVGPDLVVILYDE